MTTSPLSEAELSNIRAGESEVVELKKTTSEKNEAVKDCCAFANHKGGTVYFGVAPDGSILGQDISDQTLLDVSQVIRDNTDEKLIPEVTIWFYNGVNGIRVLITSSVRAPHTAFGSPWTRSGSATVKMPQHLYHAALLQRENDDWSRLPSAHTINDLDSDALLYLRSLLRTRNSAFLQPTDDEELLKKLSLVVDGKCTNACAVLLGKSDVLKRHYPQTEVRYLRYEKESPAVAGTDKSFVQALILTLRDLEKLFEPFISFVAVQMGMFRAEVPLLSWPVTQEAVLNACTHRDYRSNGNVYIKHYQDRLVVINPGGFLPGITSENILVSQSISRNRLLAETFQQLRYVQRAHQGTEILFSQLLHWGKGEPEYAATEASVTLTLPVAIRDKAWVRFIVKAQEKNQAALDAKHYLLMWEIRNLEITSSETLHNKTAAIFSRESLAHILSDLHQQGYVQKKGVGRGTLYMLGKDYFAEGKKRGRATALKGLQRQEYETLIVSHIREYGPTAIGELIGQRGLDLTRIQAGRILADLCQRGILEKIGKGRRWIKYAIHQNSINT